MLVKYLPLQKLTTISSKRPNSNVLNLLINKPIDRSIKIKQASQQAIDRPLCRMVRVVRITNTTQHSVFCTSQACKQAFEIVSRGSVNARSRREPYWLTKNSIYNFCLLFSRMLLGTIFWTK